MKIRNMMYVVLMGLFTLFSFASNEDIDKLLEGLKSSNIKARVDTLKTISRSGITDTKLFDAIKERLTSEYTSKSTNKDYLDEMAWLCKALASSGNSDYQPVLFEVSKNATTFKVKHYASESAKSIEEYAKRNLILNTQDPEFAKYSAETQKHARMLKSDLLDLKRDAAKEIIRSSTNEPIVFDVIKQVAISLAEQNNQGKDAIDTLSWLCKALGVSGNPQYIQDLEQIKHLNRSVTISKYVRESIKSLGGK